MRPAVDDYARRAPSLAAFLTFRRGSLDWENASQTRVHVSGSTVPSWICFFGREGLVDAARRLAEIGEMQRGWLAGSVGDQAYADEAFGEIRELAPAVVDALLDRWVAAELRPMIGDAARALVGERARSGDMLILASASCELLARACARELGIELFVGGIPEVSCDGLYTGRQIGPHAFGRGKLERVDLLLGAMGLSRLGFDEMRAYSDSAHDLPLLRAATLPFAVDPEPELMEIATQESWPVLRLAPSAFGG